jgi:hypothetical protein
MTDLTFCSWDGQPTIWISGYACMFRGGRWVPTEGAAVGREARVMSELEFKRKFPGVPPLPAFMRPPA